VALSAQLPGDFRPVRDAPGALAQPDEREASAGGGVAGARGGDPRPRPAGFDAGERDAGTLAPMVTLQAPLTWRGVHGSGPSSHWRELRWGRQHWGDRPVVPLVAVPRGPATLMKAEAIVAPSSVVPREDGPRGAVFEADGVGPGGRPLPRVTGNAGRPSSLGVAYE